MQRALLWSITYDYTYLNRTVYSAPPARQGEMDIWFHLKGLKTSAKDCMPQMPRTQHVHMHKITLFFFLVFLSHCSSMWNTVANAARQLCEHSTGSHGFQALALPLMSTCLCSWTNPALPPSPSVFPSGKMKTFASVLWVPVLCI